MRTWLEIKTLTLTRGGPRELSMVGSGCVVNVQRLGVESPKKSWGSLGRVGRQATRTCKGPRQACNFTLGRITRSRLLLLEPFPPAFSTLNPLLTRHLKTGS